MQLWTGGEDGGIVQWRVPGPSRSEEAGADASDDRDPTPVAFLSGHTDRVSALCAVGDVVVSAGDDGVVCAWSIAKGASRCVARRAMGGEDAESPRSARCARRPAVASDASPRRARRAGRTARRRSRS